jgi:hypothetical protein
MGGLRWDGAGPSLSEDRGRRLLFPPRKLIFGVHHTIGEFFLFFLVSLSAAGVGWDIVVVASRIEHERQERYAERHGKKGPAVPLPKPSDVKAPSPSPISGPQQRPPP